MTKSSAALVAELLGAFLLTSAVLFGANPFLALVVIVLVFGAVSGAHVNPAVSAGLASIKRITSETMMKFWVAQLAGALLARVAYGYLKMGEVSLNMSFVSMDMKDFVAEILGAAVFLTGVTMALGYKLEGFRLAAAVGGSLMLGAAFGGLLNPAIAFGFEDVHFASILGPLLGGLLGAQVGTMLVKASK